MAIELKVESEVNCILAETIYEGRVKFEMI